VKRARSHSVIAIVLLATVLALDGLSRLDQAAVERVYSRAVYPRIAALLGGLTGWLPLSVAEWLLVGAVVALPFGLPALNRRLRDPGTPLLRRLGGLLWDGLAVGAAVYGAFLLLWGINYRRLPLAAIAGLDVKPVAIAELQSLCGELVLESNRLRMGVAEDENGVMRLEQGRAEVLSRTTEGFARAREAREPIAVATSAPKPVFFSTALSYLGITGMYVPFTGEANVNVSVPDPDLPFSASHELAHAQGFAREDEANYLGYLACRMHPDPEFRYSGALAASLYASAALAAVDRDAYLALESRRSGTVRRDIAALTAWSDRYRGPFSRASQAVNNAYLRSQGQIEGVRSYGRMVDLLLAERRRAKIHRRDPHDSP